MHEQQGRYYYKKLRLWLFRGLLAWGRKKEKKEREKGKGKGNLFFGWEARRPESPCAAARMDDDEFIYCVMCCVHELTNLGC